MSALPHGFESLARASVIALLVLAALLPSSAVAHKASDSYVQFEERAAGAADMRWDIALRDLDLLLDLDADGDRRLSWGEVRRRLPEVEAHAMAALVLNGGRCALALAPAGVEERIDGTYLALTGRVDCRGAAIESIGYRLLADLDPTHRGLVRLTRADGRLETLALDPRAGPVRTGPSAGQGGQGFFSSGLHHVLIGFDHMLFLLCLLLPAVLRREAGRWLPVATAGEALWPVAGTVTLFTLGHSLTMALASAGVVSLPGRVVEPAIAATIVVAALNNLRPSWGLCNKIYTFLFGLIHGFGFAGALAELDLPRIDFALALLHFNLGVEAGQLIVVAIACSALLALRRLPAYPASLMPRASMLAMAIAGGWFVERSFGLSLFS